MDGVDGPEAADAEQSLAAAAAAVADEGRMAPDVLAELDQVKVPSLMQQIEPLLDADGPGDTVPGQGVGDVAEGQADIQRRRAGLAQVPHLVAAVADADGPVLGRFDHFAGPLVVEDMEGLVFGQGRLVDEDPTDLRGAVHEQGLDELFLHVHVLVEELGQELLVDVAPYPHQRELEETGHRRRQGVDGHAFMLAVDEQAASRQRFQDLARLGLGRFPDAAALAAVKGLMGRAATSPASFSENRMPRILNRSSEGGAPWAKRFSRSTRLR